jgi:hypothetical protein
MAAALQGMNREDAAAAIDDGLPVLTALLEQETSLEAAG